MDIKTQLLDLTKRIPELKKMTSTEEATKNAFVMPFLQMLGYNVFNPAEVVPEFTADVGLKKGEKVDYALMHEGEPTVIIECKHWAENLENHDAQLTRYFAVSTVRFGILTNGVEYKFYTDLEKPNVKDSKPFFEFNLENMKEANFHGIKKFMKEGFNLDNILDEANTLKYNKEIKEVFAQLIENPTDDFVKLIANQFYSGRITQKLLEQFRELVKKSINQHISDKVSDRLQSALNVQKEAQEEQIQELEEKEPEIITTEEEIEAHLIVKAIASAKTTPENIVLRDNKSYCSIIFGDNNRKPIIRLFFNGGKKYVEVFDREKNGEKVYLDTPSEIYSLTGKIQDTVAFYNEN